YRDSIYIAAEPQVVFDYFTKPEALVRWMGDRAFLDPRPGGEFTLSFGGNTVRGRYLEVDAPSRVVISWGRGGSYEFPPHSSTLEVILTPQGEGTLAPGGLPEAELPKHAAGGRPPRARLAIAVRGGGADHGAGGRGGGATAGASSSQSSWRRKSATLSPTIIVGRFVLARGTY